VSDLGARLKRAREARGLSLQDIALTTKISVVALEALERHDYSRLPGGIFGRAFVRAYASAVGLDAEQAVQEFLEERARREREAEKVVRRPEVTVDDRQFLDRQMRAMRVMRGVVVAVAVISVGALAYQLWAWWPRTPVGEAGEGASDRPMDTPVQTPPASADRARPAGPAPAPAPVDPTEPPPRTESTGLPMVFEFAATSTCWLHLIADGVVVFNRELATGERHRVEAARELRIHAGSAGELEWTIDGQPARALGQPGATARATVTRRNVKTYLQFPLQPPPARGGAS